MFIRKLTKRCSVCGGEMKLAQHHFSQWFSFGSKEPIYEIIIYYVDGLGEAYSVSRNKRSNFSSFSIIKSEMDYASQGLFLGAEKSPGTTRFVIDNVLYEWLRKRIKHNKRYIHEYYDCVKCKSTIAALIDKEKQKSPCWR